MPDVSLEDASKDLVLELITRLRNLHVDATAEDKTKRKTGKREKESVLREEFKVDAAATAVAKHEAEQRALPTTGAVRVSLCSADKPSEKKLVVLQRAPHIDELLKVCLLYTSPSPRDKRQSRMPSSA